MRKSTFILYSSICLALLLTSCKKYVESDDVNINPTKPSNATLNTILPGVIDATANGQFWSAYTTSLLSQHLASYQGGPINDDQQRDVRMGTAYRVLFQNAMTNANLLIVKATEQGSPHYAAIGKILFAISLSTTTDIFGDIPYTEAFKAPEILYPKYDSQESIYTALTTIIDDAISDIPKVNPTSLKPSTDDLIFNGDMAAWKKTAYALKARLAIHKTKKGGAEAGTNALTALENAFTDGSKDCQLVYNDKNFNPWAINVANRILTGNLYVAPSKRFVNILNGVSYPGLIDPRIDLMIGKKTGAASYVGLENGSGATNNTVDLNVNTYFGKTTSPLFIITFSEQKFIEAEARFLANGGTKESVGSTIEAYNAYLDGIKAHMKKLGVPDANINTYISNALVGVGKDNLTLSLIMKEKNIALYLQNEAWTDVRRYDYDPSIFTGMALPANHDNLLKGIFIRRSLYPNDELNRNPNAVKAITTITDKVWWDK